MKKCFRCKKLKLKIEFSQNNSKRDKLQTYCMPCKNSYDKQYEKKHKQQKRQYYLKNKEVIKEKDIKRNYGISIEEIKIMYLKLKGLCPLCQKTMELGGNGGNTVCIDHDHSTGKIRGLLCSHCNFMLGQAFDNIKTLENAIKYLKGGLSNVR